MRTLLLSPHLDDAALSCAARLQSGTVAEIVTVFAGLPTADAPLSDWDILTRAGNPRQRMVERRAEDTAAWVSVSQAFRHLDYVESEAALDFNVLTRDLAALARPYDLLLAPAGLGRHPHHLLVRDAALAAVGPDTKIILYGELPYAAFFGWPTSDADLDVEGHWRRNIAGSISGALLRPTTMKLTNEQLAWKLALLAHYPSQVPAVSGGCLRLFETTILLHYEVEFEMA
jgi:LmbE family N-acetylglucosaminyl deacetylase